MPTAPWAPWAFVGWRNVSQLLIREQRFACLTLVSGYLRWRLANSFCFLKRRALTTWLFMIFAAVSIKQATVFRIGSGANHHREYG